MITITVNPDGTVRAVTDIPSYVGITVEVVYPDDTGDNAVVELE